MAIVQAILTALFQQAGRLLNTIFGWATTLLFGQVPQERQLYLSIMALGSVVWLLAVLGMVFPWLGTFLLTFIPLPEWVDPAWVRLAMLVLAVVVPVVVGLVSRLLQEPEEREPGWLALGRSAIDGYLYSVGFALTLVAMLLIAPVWKGLDLIARWTTAHVPVVVAPRDYLQVVEDIQRVLREGGLETTRDRASWMLRWPTRLFSFFAGGPAAGLVARQLTVLRSPRIEVLLHPSDLVIRGLEMDVNRVHALITARLTFTDAYLTWSREAQTIEDQLEQLWHEAQDASAREDALDRLRAIEHTLETVDVPYEEWEVLFREKLLVEAALLREARGEPEPHGAGVSADHA